MAYFKIVKKKVSKPKKKRVSKPKRKKATRNFLGFNIEK
jgi:hypothetical protein